MLNSINNWRISPMSDNILTNDASLSSEIKKILVVGDWVVDEHWVTGIHRSPTASRTGKAYYRSLHDEESTVQALCAAGQTASILNKAKRRQTERTLNQFCEIMGIGMWHHDDTDTLASMLEISNLKGKTPHRVSSPNITKTSSANLFNLGELLPTDSERRYPHGTTHVIRIYQNTGAKIELLQRIDWELPFPSNQRSWIKDENTLNDKELLKKFLNNKQVNAIVIKDICKGVVSSALVRWLASKYQNIPWFISSKAWQPDWFRELKNVDVRLLLIPQVAARRAVKNGKLSRWITRNGSASKGALDTMDGLIEEYFKKQNPSPLLVTLPSDSTILACYVNETNKKYGILQKDAKPQQLSIDVPMASVFFAALVTLILSDKERAVTNLLKSAFNFTQDWMEFESQRVEKPEDWDPRGKEPYLLLGSNVPENVKKYNPDVLVASYVNPNKNKYEDYGKWSDPFDWDQEKEEWKDAFSNYGIIKRKDKDGKERKYIELWRTMTEVDGYVCCVTSKRKVLQTLSEELISFRDIGKRRHKSFMLVASPGSGKTFLVKCLAGSFGFRYLPFNITQMFSKTDILDCFDTIVTTQSQNREEPMLVFVDEINAKLDSQFVYDTFLAPLEEGVYVRAGKTFHIDPCVWVFAGTERPLKKNVKDKKGVNDEENTDKSIKASDFESRLTIPPLSIKIDKYIDIIKRVQNEKDIVETRERLEKDQAELQKAKTEKVYLGVMLIRAFFPDVRWVSEKVLELFYAFNPDLEVRELGHFVKSFTDIQYCKVFTRNVSIKWLQDHKDKINDIENIKNWIENEVDNPQGDMVEIARYDDM